jgi:hypothetical protein
LRQTGAWNDPRGADFRAQIGGEPRDIQDVVAVSPLTVGRLCSGKVDDQLLRPDLDARNMGVDEAAVVNWRRCFEMLPNRPYDQRLDVGCRHPAD